MNQVIEHKAATIKLVGLDNDGVLTDGRVYVDQDGRESKSFDIRDGFGIIMARRAGLVFVVITGRKNAIIETRAATLGIEEVHQGFLDKLRILKEIAEQRDLPLSQIAFMGDDLFDLPVMRAVGLSGAPCDAHPDVIAEADWVSQFPGGRGAVREFAELIIKAQGQWPRLTSFFAAEDAGV